MCVYYWALNESSSLYCSIRNSDQMTIGKTHPTLSNLNPKKLTSSIVKDTFLASSTTTSKISSLLNLCEELIKSNVDDIRLLNSVLFMISLLIQRINHFFENGCLTPFFKLLYGEFDVVIKRIEALWVGFLSNHIRPILRVVASMESLTFISAYIGRSSQ